MTRTPLKERTMDAGDRTHQCGGRSRPLAMEISFPDEAKKDEQVPAVNLQDAFLKFRQKRQKEIQQAKDMEKKAIESRSNPQQMSKLRQKFVEQAKLYFGVPYAKRYHEPGTAFYDSPLFLDCCGLVRQVLRDLKEDFGFVIGPWNQAYLYDVLPIVIDKEEDMKPGDLVFISGTYFNPKSKAQRHDMVHVEIWLGDKEKTIGARWQKGVVQVHDSYKFEAKSYHNMQYHFRSIDTWLTGMCKSYCLQHTWRRSKFMPGQKSVFALLIEGDTYSQDQPAEGQEDQTAQNEVDEDWPVEHEEATALSDGELTKDKGETAFDEDCPARHKEGTAKYDDELVRNKGETAFNVDQAAKHEEGTAKHDDKLIGDEGETAFNVDRAAKHEEVTAKHDDELVGDEGETEFNEDRPAKYEVETAVHEDWRAKQEEETAFNENWRAKHDGETATNEDRPAIHDGETELSEDWPAKHEEETAVNDRELTKGEGKTAVYEDRPAKHDGETELSEDWPAKHDGETELSEDWPAKHEEETAVNDRELTKGEGKNAVYEDRPAKHDGETAVNEEEAGCLYLKSVSISKNQSSDDEKDTVNYEEGTVSYKEESLKDDAKTLGYGDDTVNYEDKAATGEEDTAHYEDDFTVNYKTGDFEKVNMHYEAKIMDKAVDTVIYEDRIVSSEEESPTVFKDNSVSSGDSTVNEGASKVNINIPNVLADEAMDVPKVELCVVDKNQSYTYGEMNKEESVVQERCIENVNTGLPIPSGSQLPSSELCVPVQPFTPAAAHCSFSNSKFLECVEHYKSKWKACAVQCPNSNDSRGAKSTIAASPSKPVQGRGSHSRSGRCSSNGQHDNSDKRKDRSPRPTRVKAPAVTTGTHQPTFFLGGANGNWMIEETLLSLGWKRTEDKYDESFSLKWVECKSHINYNTFREGSQLVNHISNIGLLTTKMGLLSSLQEHDRVMEKTSSKARIALIDFFPESYRLGNTAEKTKFVQQIYKDGEVWICKPTGLNQGKGIYLVNNKQQLIDKLGMNLESPQVPIRRRHISRPPQGRIIQRYISNPLLLNGCKFDVRAYMLIASTRPYIVLYHPGYVRLSCVPYTPYTSDGAQGLHAHLTNQYVQKMHPLYSSLKEETVWSFERLQTYIDENVRRHKELQENWVNNTFEKRMQQIMLVCFESVRQKLHRRMGYFDLLGFDFMVDENFKVWLLEINVNPALHTNCQVLMDRIPDIVHETLKLVIEIFEKTKKKRQVFPLQELRAFRVLYNGEGKR